MNEETSQPATYRFGSSTVVHLDVQLPAALLRPRWDVAAGTHRDRLTDTGQRLTAHLDTVPGVDLIRCHRVPGPNPQHRDQSLLRVHLAEGASQEEVLRTVTARLTGLLPGLDLKPAHPSAGPPDPADDLRTPVRAPGVGGGD